MVETKVVTISENQPSEYEYEILKYSRIPGERYEILIDAFFTDDLATSYQGKIIYLIEVTPLLVQILGGNRQQGYSSDMKIQGIA